MGRGGREGATAFTNTTTCYPLGQKAFSYYSFVSVCISLSLPHSPAHFRTLSHTLAHFRTLTHTLAHPRTVSHTLSLSLPPTCSLYFLCSPISLRSCLKEKQLVLDITLLLTYVRQLCGKSANRNFKSRLKQKNFFKGDFHQQFHLILLQSYCYFLKLPHVAISSLD